MSDSRSDDKDTPGYRHPPKASRFKPGQSGNPRGRTKGVRNFSTDLREELEEKISISDGGSEVRISKQRALIKTLFAAAFNGDFRATSTLVSLCVRLFPDESEQESINGLSHVDAQILDSYVDRELKRRETPSPTKLHKDGNHES